MCERTKSSTKKIDSCLQTEIDYINNLNGFKTLLSCCGHNKYPPTIVVLEKETDQVFEWYSRFNLSKGKRKPFKYYKKDAEGFYYIPETVTIIIKPSYSENEESLLGENQ